MILKGLDADYGLIETPKMKYGRFISRMDVIQGRKVCVLGKRVYDNLFPQGGDPCGKYVKVGGIYYEVIGLNVSATNMSINGSADRSVVIPINLFQSAFNRGNEVELLAMTVRPGNSSTAVQEKVRQALYRKYYIHPQDKSAMIAVNAERMYSMVDSLFKGLNLLVWLVGLGTLLASTETASTAVPKLTWKLASTPIEPASISTAESISTENIIPRAPADTVRITLSDIIWPRIILGVAPIARRIPISVVLSLTVTIMILDTPTAPARRVPRPTLVSAGIIPLSSPTICS